MVHLNKLKLSIVCISLLAVQSAGAQTKIGGTGAGDASAVLELQSTTNNQGFLPVRLTTAQRNAITSPATGLMIYNTDDQCLNVYKGSTNGWFNMCSGAGGFSFTNCASPTVTGTLTIGSASTATVTLNYVNNTGNTAVAFSSGTVSGLTLTASGGSVTPVTAGSSSITLNITGTPTTSGTINVPVVIAGASCVISFTVAGCSDPGSTAGNTGCVAFIYRGSTVVYATVRGKDGKIWSQQNLGSSQVAVSGADPLAIGDLFQWGRWDDGHQVRSPLSTQSGTVPSPSNPSGIPSGTNIFYTNPGWWQSGATSDTWTGTTISATNGKDPCAAMGSGWHVPSKAEWTTAFASTAENITNNSTAYSSALKFPVNAAYLAYRDWSGGSLANASGGGGWYWTSTPSSANSAYYLAIDGGQANTNSTNNRGYGFAVRCMK